MNKREMIRESERLLDPKFNSKENVVKFNRGSTPKHELAKALLALEAIYNNDPFVQEAVFLNGCRPDQFMKARCEAWEVLESETKIDFYIQKVKRYPCKTLPFYAEDVIEHNLKMFLPGWIIRRPKK